MIILLICINIVSAESGAKYLRDTINDLQMKNVPHQPIINQNHQMPLSIRRTYTPTTPPEIENSLDETEEIVTASNKVDSGPKVPALHLTKQELAALYASAINKGDTIKLDGGDNSGNPISAAVHELTDNMPIKKKPTKKPEDGYYYYYYPLKSFAEELASSVGAAQIYKPNTRGDMKNTRKNTSNFQNSKHKPQAYYHHYPEKEYLHSHTHQHNILIETATKATSIDTDKKKGLEPLFMAISGFIGMTVMFILSVLVLPKFKKMKPKGFGHDEHLFDIGRVALEAIDGYDCSERFACEAGKAANALHVYNNRFVKLLRRIGPISIGKQLDKVGKYTDKRYRCANIRCRKRPS